MSSIDKLLPGLKKRFSKVNGEISLTFYWQSEIPTYARKNINLTLV